MLPAYVGARDSKQNLEGGKITSGQTILDERAHTFHVADPIFGDSAAADDAGRQKGEAQAIGQGGAVSIFRGVAGGWRLLPRATSVFPGSRLRRLNGCAQQRFPTFRSRAAMEPRQYFKAYRTITLNNQSKARLHGRGEGVMRSDP